MENFESNDLLMIKDLLVSSLKLFSFKGKNDLLCTVDNNYKI